MAEYEVFLSYNSRDRPTVVALARRLTEEGVRCWLDLWNLIPGDPWQEKMEEALERCAVCAVFLGPGGFGPWEDKEMRAALQRHVDEGQGGRFRVIPVLLPGARRKGVRLPRFLSQLSWVEFPTPDDPDALRRLVCGIHGELPGLRPGDESAPTLNPYRWLRPFDVADARFFFGREDWTARLLSKLRESGRDRFLALVGPSGSGKSSLARAGLLASLGRGEIEGSENWPVVVCEPKSEPLKSLAAEMSRKADGALAVADALELCKEMAGSHEALDMAARLKGRRLVIFVDQLEGIFAPACEEADRSAFLGNLVRAATASGGPALVLVTLRADFYSQWAAYPEFARLLSEHQRFIGAMTPDELQRVIEEPTEEAGCELQPGLAKSLREHVEGQASLPLLQFALSELWERRSGRWLTHAAYEEIGELKGALQRRADKIHAELGESEKEVCRKIFLQLTQPVEGGPDTSRPASLEEILACGAGAEGVVEALVEARLLVTTETRDEGPIVKVAHEVLIQKWPLLREWVGKRRRELLLRRDLEDQAHRWEAKGRDESYVFRGAQLAETQEWRQTSGEVPGRLERDFLDASLELRDREARKEKERQKQELAQARALAETERRVRQADRRRAVVTVAAIGLVAAGAIYAALREEARGLAASAPLQARASLETAPQLALLFGLEAWRRAEGMEPSFVNQAEEVVRQALAQIGGQPFASFPAIGRLIAVDPGGKRIAAAGEDGRLGVWPLSPESKPLLLAETGLDLHELVFSPSGRWLAAVGKDNVVRLWDLSRAGVKPRLLEHEKPLTSVFPAGMDRTSYVAFSEGERWIATRAEKEPVRVWGLEPASGVQPLGRGEDVEAAAFGGDQYLAIGSRMGAEVCALAEPGSSRCSPVYEGEVLSLVFRRTERSLQLLVAAQERLMRWDSSTPSMFTVLGSCYRHIRWLGLAPGSRWLLALGDDDGPCLWDLAEPIPALVTLGGGGKAAFHPDGKALFLADLEGRVVRWDLLDRPASRVELKAGGETIERLAIDPSGRWLAAVQGNQALLWDESRSEPHLLRGHDGAVEFLSFDAGGRWLVTGADGEAPRLWNLLAEDPSASTEPLVLPPQTSPVEALVFDGGRPVSKARPQPEVSGPGVSASARSQDGRWTAVGGENGKCFVQDQRHGGPPIPLRNHDGPVHTIAFSPDSCWLVTAAVDGKVRLWRMCDESPVKNPEVLYVDGPVLSVAFDPKSRWLASAGRNLSYLRDLQSVSDRPRPLPGYQGRARSMSFSPDGRRLVTGGQDGLVQLWDLDDGHPALLPIALRGHRQAVLAAAFDRDSRRLATGDAGGEIRIWRMERKDVRVAACRAPGRTLTPDEWKQVAGWWPPYRRTCENWGDVGPLSSEVHP